MISPILSIFGIFASMIIVSFSYSKTYYKKMVTTHGVDFANKMKKIQKFSGVWLLIFSIISLCLSIFP